MCQYCDFREPDRFGVSIDGKGVDALTMTIHEGGTVHLRGYCDYSRVEDRYQFNYCPMCGRKLSDDDSVEDKQHYKPKETYAIFTETSCGAESVVFSWKDVLDYVQEVMDNGADDYVEVFQKVAEARLRCSMDWV